MTPRITRLIAALAAATAVTACTTTANGVPHPQPETEDTSTSPPSTSTNSQAPRVTNPLDASTFVAEPCSSLTSAQLGTFEVRPPGTPRGGDGVLTPGCSWHGDAGSISIGWLTENKGGLSDTYRGRELEAYFVETTVDEYPAVFTDANDSRPQGHCGIVVGISDTMTFYATVDTRLDADGSCALAKQVAAAALATVKEAN